MPVIRVRADWYVKCHPATFDTFRVQKEVEEFREELDAFIAHCTDGMVFLDGGANYGAFALAALHYGGEHARVITVDPSAETNRVLGINIGLAGAVKRTTIIQAAIGERDGDLPMLSTGPAGEHFMVFTGEERPDAIRVPHYSIGSIVRKAGCPPTHVKLDVEGFEHEAILGGSEFLHTARPLLFLELHGDVLRRRGHSPQELLERLSELGYSRFERFGKPIAIADAAAMSVARIVCVPVMK